MGLAEAKYKDVEDTMSETARELLQGAIDFHLHTMPDIIPRSQHVLELAESAREMGMGGFVLKGHFGSTVDRAQIVQRIYPDLKIFGGLVLNWPACGGLNVEAARAAIGLGGKVIWLPTMSAQNHITWHGSHEIAHMGGAANAYPKKVVKVLDEDGKTVLPELIEIMRLVADADIVLATGHVSAEETKIIFAEAKRVGVKKFLVTHPEIAEIHMSVEDQLELAAAGAMFERCICSITISPPAGATSKLIADQIRMVGVRSSIMSTDYGQTVAPLPVPGMLSYIEQMLEYGIQPAEIKTMVQSNPARLLGLS